MDDAFADLFEGNERYAAVEHEVVRPGVARRGLAIVTCIDSRIDPLAVFGLVPGDAKILRNAGARVTADVLRTLALAAAALGVTRIAVVQHTDCKMDVGHRRASCVGAVGGDRAGRPCRTSSRSPSTTSTATLARDVERGARQRTRARTARWSPASSTTCTRAVSPRSSPPATADEGIAPPEHRNSGAKGVTSAAFAPEFERVGVS